MQDRDHGTGMSYEDLLARSKKMKKRVITVVAIILAAMLLLIAAVWGLSVLLQKTKKPPQFDYEFYPTYEGDIMEYPAYLELQRDILYAESFDGMGYTTSITDENRDSFDEYVLFLCDYLQTIIAGDADAYNSFFSDGYLKEYGRQANAVRDAHCLLFPRGRRSIRQGDLPAGLSDLPERRKIP